MIGTTLAHYRVTGALGAGGMGAVYRATDTRLGREVALKVLPEEMAADPERIARFQREARALAALDHPGIVTVYSVEEAGGVRFLTMQLVAGRSLERELADGPLPVPKILATGRAIAEALAVAHEKGIVHRDLKPANVMVADDGHVKVLDFGLASLGGGQETRVGDAGDDALTREGTVMGTLPYMSPEQVLGRATDHRSDVFSLGIVLYELASGRRPFAGDTAVELSSAILRDEPPPLAAQRKGLPTSLERVVRRCLQKSPEQRFQRMAEVVAALGGGKVASAPGRAGIPLWGALAVTLFLVVGFYAARQLFGAKDAQPLRSIAVLPLTNHSGDAAQDYFAEGMTDELTAYLARISQLRVISRGSAMQFQGEQRPPAPEIARVLDVDAIVEGSVMRDGDRVRITAQLVDARADRHLWADSFERRSTDVLTLQAELASAIAREIHVQLTPAERTRLQGSRAVDPEAYDAYLKGRYFLNRPSDENLQKAIARFEEAIAASPEFVPALSGLSDATLWAGYNEGFLTASEARPKARRAAEEAIRLDDNSAEARTSLATFKVWYEYDWAGAEAEYRRAFALNPSYAYAHDQFAMALAFQGRFDESVAESRLAAELDPLNPQILLDATVGLAFRGDYDAAHEVAQRSERLDPNSFFAHWCYGWIDVQAGRIDESIGHFEQAKTMGAPAFNAAWLVYALARTGDRERAAAAVELLKSQSLRGVVTGFNQAIVALGAGETDRAMSYLEQAYAEDSQWLGWLGHDRIFEPLRGAPRFVALSKKVRLRS